MKWESSPRRRLGLAILLASPLAVADSPPDRSAGGESAPAAETPAEAPGNNGTGANAGGEMAEITVTGSRLVREPVTISPVGSATVVNRELLQQQQPPDLYEALQDVPSVSFDGGARRNGRNIVIRGFSDNEDVSFRVDGARQNFEKYRFGSAIGIEPDLIREVEVIRGAARISEGVGSLGGLVSVRTLRASDFLDSDERWGIRSRAGFQSNDDGREASITAAARPLDAAEVLFSMFRSESNDFRLPDGSRLPDSSESRESRLAKVNLYGTRAEAALTYRDSKSEALEPFDATGGGPGVGGTVRRESSERSATLNTTVMPGPEWLNLTGVVAFTNKEVVDRGSQIAGNGTDTITYDVLTTDFRNAFQYDFGRFRAGLEAGVQLNLERRESLRVNDSFAGENPAQPSGEKRNLGAFLEPTLGYGPLTVTGGLRYDAVTIGAGDLTSRILDAQGRDTELSYGVLTPALTASFALDDDRLTGFYSYAEAFRPPLLDEVFVAGAFSRCQPFSRYTDRPTSADYPLPPVPTAPNAADFANPLDYVAALDDYADALGAWGDAVESQVDALIEAEAAYNTDPFRKGQALCFDAYEPERMVSHEIGFSARYDGVLFADDLVTARVVYYRSVVSNLLESIMEDSVTGEISQPGVERRQGVEFELAWDSSNLFGQLAYSFIDGTQELNYFENNVSPLIAELATPEDAAPQLIPNVSRHTLSATLGARANRYGIEGGYRIRAVSSREVISGTDPRCPGGVFSVPTCLLRDRQPGFLLHNLFASWRALPSLTLRATVNNLTNAEYQLPGFGGGAGIVAPGRDIRVAASYRF